MWLIFFAHWRNDQRGDFHKRDRKGGADDSVRGAKKLWDGLYGAPRVPLLICILFILIWNKLRRPSINGGKSGPQSNLDHVSSHNKEPEFPRRTGKRIPCTTFGTTVLSICSSGRPIIYLRSNQKLIKTSAGAAESGEKGRILIPAIS
jgi:hypothetical protein